MSQFAAMILPEFDEEMANTRKVLERVPDEKFDWRCHPKSNTMGWNANHLAEIPGWVEGTLTQPFWDAEPENGPKYAMPQCQNTKEVLELFDKNVAEGHAAIAAVKDEDTEFVWSLKVKGTPIITMPRKQVIRAFILSHTIHHRAHLCVYLRLNDIPVPGMYGPSADE
ncbi:DinB family protein [Anatilimnocola aggregata]|uniref:DinB family protein n=1 Tax=Anatilimnocola aggregata TaxID=2528021 RepID=A0A517Y6Y4_9BACT|nr:DinB family protein [Anatilimnocola aggregata]QDU25980.1 DinB family protein [Anatilimnocola aggregata]